MELLSVTWYFEHPFDYELKQYLLLAYLRKVEDCFLEKKLSPHLLHLEKIKNELFNFNKSYNSLINGIEKRKYKYFENEKVDGLYDNKIPEIKDVVDFSLPQVESKLDFGYKIFKVHKQILY